MMETWEAVKSIISFIILPVVGGLMYFVRKHISRLDNVEKDLHDQKIKTAVIETKVDDIRDDIKEIKSNVEKLVNRT